jgi:hypothetical protein
VEAVLEVMVIRQLLQEVETAVLAVVLAVLRLVLVTVLVVQETRQTLLLLAGILLLRLHIKEPMAAQTQAI